MVMRAFLLIAFLAMIRPGTVAAQGTIAFSNIGPGLNAPAYLSDGTTKLSGAQFMAELLAGTSASSLSPIATTGFFQGVGAGYFSQTNFCSNTADKESYGGYEHFCADDYTWSVADSDYFYFAWCDRSRTNGTLPYVRPDADAKIAIIRF